MKEMKVNTDEITAKSLNICKPSLAQEGSRFECVSLTSLFLHFFSSFLLHWTNRTNCHWEHMSDIKPSSFSDLGTALIWLLQETSKHIFEPVASDSLCWFKEWTPFSATPTKNSRNAFSLCVTRWVFYFPSGSAVARVTVCALAYGMETGLDWGGPNTDTRAEKINPKQKKGCEGKALKYHLLHQQLLVTPKNVITSVNEPLCVITCC